MGFARTKEKILELEGGEKVGWVWRRKIDLASLKSVSGFLVGGDDISLSGSSLVWKELPAN